MPLKGTSVNVDHRAAAEFIARNMRIRLDQGLDRVILYGSVARHEERPDSDVDLIVVAKHYKQAHDALLDVMGALLEQDAPYVSVRIVTQEQVADMERRHASFWETVSREGETLA